MEAQRGNGIEEALQVKLRVLFSLAEHRLVIAQLEDVLRRPRLPAPYIHHYTPSGLSVHMEKVKDGDAITESALAQQRGVSETGPAG